jgi:hypothetical protein
VVFAGNAGETIRTSKASFVDFGDVIKFWRRRNCVRTVVLKKKNRKIFYSSPFLQLLSKFSVNTDTT